MSHSKDINKKDYRYELAMTLTVRSLKYSFQYKRQQNETIYSQSKLTFFIFLTKYSLCLYPVHSLDDPVHKREGTNNIVYHSEQGEEGSRVNRNICRTIPLRKRKVSGKQNRSTQTITTGDQSETGYTFTNV